ncbi:hypothetical protein [Dongia deserti]|uniref:hypothetical protein n=1 Tax=Dongia deserti TaxID=2268030 RepID=UPI000E65AEF8|nr:hypothetical protein [Dongia deserti]
MEHKTLEKLRDVAVVVPNWRSTRSLSKYERLQCWAEALDREGGRQLNTLFRVEYAPPAERAKLRADDSLLSVAYADPRLRTEGLAGDTVGHATAFFGLSERELHDITCFCHYGPTIAADTAAAQIRATAARQRYETRPMLACAVIAASLAAGLLLL